MPRFLNGLGLALDFGLFSFQLDFNVFRPFIPPLSENLVFAKPKLPTAVDNSRLLSQPVCHQ